MTLKSKVISLESENSGKQNANCFITSLVFKKPENVPQVLGYLTFKFLKYLTYFCLIFIFGDVT